MKLGERPFYFFLCSLFFLASACAKQPNSAVASATPQSAIIPFQTSAPTSTLAISVAGVTPSPTPYMYTVLPNDTFYSISTKLNVDLNALMAANPSVSARLLQPGTQILIPVEGQTLTATTMPTLTPVAALVSPASCYSSSAGELWCFLLVTNDSDRTMENLIGEVNLLSANGTVLATEQANPALDILPPGGRMPLVAYFASAPEGWAGAQGSLLTGFWLPEGDDHYLDTSIINFDWQVGDAETKLSANVRGTVQLKSGRTAKTVWVLAIAYNAADNPVGFRRWESAGGLDFDFWVYSLGPKIEKVEVLVEAPP